MRDRLLRPYIIGVLSQKGGVGKTTVAVNLAMALKLLNKRVLLIDADTDNPAVGLHLGMEGVNIGFEDLVAKGSNLGEVIAVHGSSGVHCILGTLHTRPFQMNTKHTTHLFRQLDGCNYDFVVIDTAPGLQHEEDTMPFDDAVIVATPDLPALTSALRLAEELKGSRSRYSLTLNRITGKSYELRPREIEGAWGGKTAALLPEDVLVSESLAARIPASLSSSDSPFTAAMRKLAKTYADKAKRASSHGPNFYSWKRHVAESERSKAQEAKRALLAAEKARENEMAKQESERQRQATQLRSEASTLRKVKSAVSKRRSKARPKRASKRKR